MIRVTIHSRILREFARSLSLVIIDTQSLIGDGAVPSIVRLKLLQKDKQMGLISQRWILTWSRSFPSCPEKGP